MHRLPLGTSQEFKCCSAIASETPFTTPTPKVPNPKAGKVWTRRTSFVQRYMTQRCMSSLKLSFSCYHPAAEIIHWASVRKKTNISTLTHLCEKRQWIFKAVKVTEEKVVQSWLELSKILSAAPHLPWTTRSCPSHPLSFASPDPRVACSYLPGTGVSKQAATYMHKPRSFQCEMTAWVMALCNKSKGSRNCQQLRGFHGWK